MIICIDIGNTNTVIGTYKDDKLIQTLRIKTDTSLTADEYGIKILECLYYNKINKSEINGVIVSSVVPYLDRIISEMVKKYFALDAIFVSPGIKTSINIRLNNPKECGADLLVGAVGAVEKYGNDVIVIDMGTAITMIYINDKNEFLGGVIMPGVHTAYQSLFSATAKLESVGINDVTQVIGKDTRASLQSGMVFGTVSMIEGMIDRFKETYKEAKVVITGGESKTLYSYFNRKYKIIYDEFLLLDGLNILYKKNKGERK